VRQEVFYTGPFFVQWPQQNFHLYDLKVIIGSVLTAEPNWHEPMLFSFCPNNIASATQVLLGFCHCPPTLAGGKEDRGKEGPRRVPLRVPVTPPELIEPHHAHRKVSKCNGTARLNLLLLKLLHIIPILCSSHMLHYIMVWF